MNKIKWSFWNPSSGIDNKGDRYFRVGHILTIIMAYFKIVILIIIVIFISLIIKYIINE